jgi:uncharacterized protein (TIGR03437 family)
MVNNRTLALTLLTTMAVSTAYSQAVNAQAINAASGAAIVAPGSLISVFGKFDAPTGKATTLPLPTTTIPGGFSFMMAGGAGILARSVSLLYWSPSQINALLPASATSQSQFLEYIYGQPLSGRVLLSVAAQAPGIFTNPVSDCSLAADGCWQRILRGIITDGYYFPINSLNAARPGQSLVIWVTGLGSNVVSLPLSEYPVVALLPSGAAVTVKVFYAGPTTFAGLDQVNITLPGGKALSPGCVVGAHVEIPLSMKSVVTGIQSNTVLLPVVTDSCN